MKEVYLVLIVYKGSNEFSSVLFNDRDIALRYASSRVIASGACIKKIYVRNETIFDGLGYNLDDYCESPLIKVEC